MVCFPFGLSLEGWKMAEYGALPNTELCIVCGCLAAILVASSLLLRLPKLMQLPRMRSNPLSDAHHSRLVDGNAKVFSLLHMHSF
jgi:hypothetical protein